MKVVSVINYKGGVGKTTTAVNLAAAAFEHGKSVLLVDLEPQASATEYLARKTEIGLDAADVLLSTDRAGEAIYTVRPTPSDGTPANSTARIDLIPGSDSLARVQLELATSADRDALRRLLSTGSPLDNAYDLVIADTGPQKGVLSINALFAADLVVCPVWLSSPSLKGLRRIENVLERAVSLEAAFFVLPVSLHGTYRESQEILAALSDRYGDYPDGKLLPPIRSSQKFPQSYRRGQTIFEYDPTGRGAEDYRTLYLATEQILSYA